MNEDIKRWLTPVDIELEYDISINTQNKWRMKSSKIKIPYSKIGGFIKYDRIKIDKFFEENEVVGLLS